MYCVYINVALIIIYKLTCKLDHIVWQGLRRHQDHIWPAREGVLQEAKMVDLEPSLHPNKVHRDTPTTLLSKPAR